MTTALIAVLSGLFGVLLGGVMQLFVAWRERVASARRAARLLFGDLWIGSGAIEFLRDAGEWWVEEVTPPLDDWRRHREALAGAMWGPDFQTVDGAFAKFAELERGRRAGVDAVDAIEDAREAAEQAEEAAGLLLKHGFSRREYGAAKREVDRWNRVESHPDSR